MKTSYVLAILGVLSGCGGVGQPPPPGMPDPKPPVPPHSTPDASSPEDGGRDMSLPRPGDMGTPAPTPDMSTSNCKWPAGPYGTVDGKTVAPDATWDCYPPDATSQDDHHMVPIRELIDCDGSRHKNAILMSFGKVQCPACTGEAMGFQKAYDDRKWSTAGVIPLWFVLFDGQEKPASIETAWQWRTRFGIKSAYVCPNPDKLLFPKPGNGVPQNSVIDPRTMKVTFTHLGADGSETKTYDQVDELVKTNAK